MQAVFSSLSKGEAVTQGLRKVTDDMKSKNRAPEERSGAVPAAEAKAAGGAHKAPASGPPKLSCDGGRKWVVENQVDAKGLEISECNYKQTVYVYNCRNTVLQIHAKVNSICIDKCTRTSVVFTDVVAACEIVNSSSIEVQVKGVAPLIAVDNSGGAQIYLSKDSLGVTVTTAKSSEVNILMPGATADDDMLESAVPEQFVTKLNPATGKWDTESMEHSAG